MTKAQTTGLAGWPRVSLKEPHGVVTYHPPPGKRTVTMEVEEDGSLVVIRLHVEDCRSCDADLSEDPSP